MEIKLNLASKPYLNRQSVRLWLLLLGILLMVLFLLNGSYGYMNYRQLQMFDKRFQKLNDQLAGIHGTSADYSPAKLAELKIEVELANEIIDADRFRWTSLLGRFESVLPDDVSILSIQPNFRERTVKLSGVARDVSALTRFVDNLLTSEDLNQAFLLSHAEVEQEHNQTSQQLTGFSIVIREAF
jgi:type IV pilus assembly protein PilN